MAAATQVSKADLIRYVTDDLEDRDVSHADVEAMVDVLLENISAALENGESVNLPPLGKFETREQAAREARNPQTGETVHVPAKNAPKFKPAKALKDRVAY